MNLPAFYHQQFIDDDGTPLSGGFLHTYLAGTTTPEVTYQDQAGEAENTNPIELDAAGFCSLWLTPGTEYRLRLERADNTLVRTYEDVAGAAVTSEIVTSVNGETGEVELDATLIPFETGTSTDWFEGTDVAAALDAIITRSDAATPAASITIADAGGLYAATNVEAALQEVAAAAGNVPSQTGQSGKFLTTNGSATSWALPIPAQTGNAGRFLGTDGTTASWQAAPTGTSTQAANGSITFPGGLIMKWGTTSTLAEDSADNDITFPTAFPSTCFMVTGSASSGLGVGVGEEKYSISCNTFTAAGFKVDNDSEATTVSWIAIGN